MSPSGLQVVSNMYQWVPEVALKLSFLCSFSFGSKLFWTSSFFPIVFHLMTAAIHETQSSECTTPKSFCFSYLELSPSYLKVVLKLSLNCLRVLSQGCLQVVSKWSSSCLKSVPKLPKSCLKVVAQRCVQVVLKLCLSCSKWCASDDSHDSHDHHDHPDDQHGEILGAGGL